MFMRPIVLILGLIVLPTSIQAAPLKTGMQAISRLRAAGAKLPEAALEVQKACMGRLRMELRDDARLLREAQKITRKKRADLRKSALELYRCFSADKFVTKIVSPLLSDSDLSVASYAAEIAGRLEHPEGVKRLLAEQNKWKEKCLEEGLSKEQVEFCVWLAYAPGTGLPAAEQALKQKAADAAVALFASPYAKVREVSVETVYASGLKKYSKDISQLIKDEKKGKYKTKNTPALLKRFAKRARVLNK